MTEKAVHTGNLLIHLLKLSLPRVTVHSLCKPLEHLAANSKSILVIYTSIKCLQKAVGVKFTQKPVQLSQNAMFMNREGQLIYSRLLFPGYGIYED